MTPIKAPKLEDRFLEPPGYRWHTMDQSGRKVRFGYVFPASGKPDMIIVCLPGLSEFCEKYHELARDCLARNYAFFVIDWCGQGLSSRYVDAPGKRHSLGFDVDIEDLKMMIDKYVKHLMTKNNIENVPLGMIAHSMGANIGIRYLSRNPGVFSCAAFSAPMIGLHGTRMFPPPIAKVIAQLLSRFMNTATIIGLKDWRIIEDPDADPFTSDEKRGKIHNAWCRLNPDLNAGVPTHGWLYEAVLSCQQALHELETRKISTPCIIGYSGTEIFVDNLMIQKANTHLKFARIMDFEDARHEILMEQDKIRGAFLGAFYDLIDKKILKRRDDKDISSSA